MKIIKGSASRIWGEKNKIKNNKPENKIGKGKSKSFDKENEGFISG